MLQEASLVLTSDSFALFSRSNGIGKGQKGKVICEHCKKSGHSKDVCWEIHGKTVICDYCKKPGHSKDVCWDVHGKPADWKPRKGKSKGYQTSQASSNIDQIHTPLDFNKEQLSQLIKLLSGLQKTELESTHTASMAHQGEHAFLANYVNKWVVDSRASDHMTSDSKKFSTYIPSAGNEKINTANGSSSPIAGKGSVHLSPNLQLNSVLHVPYLACNLLSISKLTKQANCWAHFCSTHCIFQDLYSGKMIGSAKEQDGLYYLDDTTTSHAPKPIIRPDLPSIPIPELPSIPIPEPSTPVHDKPNTESTENERILVYSRRNKRDSRDIPTEAQPFPEQRRTPEKDGMLKHKGTYEIISPEEIGFERSNEAGIVLGKLSGRHALKSRLEELGYELQDDQLESMFWRFKSVAEQKKRVTDADLRALVSDEVFQAEPIWKLADLQVTCGTLGLSTATVKLISDDGNSHIACSVGTGPVDSAYKAVNLIVKEPATLLEYSLNAVTEGIDAIATTRVIIRGENSSTSTHALTGESVPRTFSGTGAGMDIVVSSVKAYIAALNKMLGFKETSVSAEKTAVSA
ncbi:hypothetical protein L6164_013466 [Bauhinia variegata]|uniref:Uncharacterized protein n=1 Tax=Bauhinia variegata TaxID=167791 RepID=A0ACB9NEH9_BAUVA|nr:hypothetical protein L6164_013466 [Bauhinia variegata]